MYNFKKMWPVFGALILGFIAFKYFKKNNGDDPKAQNTGAALANGLPVSSRINQPLQIKPLNLGSVAGIFKPKPKANVSKLGSIAGIVKPNIKMPTISGVLNERKPAYILGKRIGGSLSDFKF